MSFLYEVPEEKQELLELSYTIFTDGSCDLHSTSRQGGWAAVIEDNKRRRTVLQGKACDTTNNRMELQAILEALKVVRDNLDERKMKYATVNLYTDSTYCSNALREWIYVWERDGFAGRPNADLLQQLLVLVRHLDKVLHINWVPRNSNDMMTLVDRLANEERLKV